MQNFNDAELQKETNKKQSEIKSEKKIEKEKVTEAFKMEDEDAIIESHELFNIDRREENDIDEDLPDRTENNLDVDTGVSVTDKVDEKLCIGETVLVRYYKKKMEILHW